MDRNLDKSSLKSGKKTVPGKESASFFAAAGKKADPDQDELKGGPIHVPDAAISDFDPNNELPHWKREFIHQREKEAIAREARKLVKEGDTIILDASSTSWFLAQRLPDMPLTVITNAMHILYMLEGNTAINVICLGGAFTENSMSNVGEDALSGLNDFHADVAFISCSGYERTFGVSDCKEDQAMLRRKMLEISDKHVLMIDSSKWNKRADTAIAPINDFHHVITDDQSSEEEYRHVQEMGIKVTAAGIY